MKNIDDTCLLHTQNAVDIREYFNTKIENILTLIHGNDENYKTQFSNAKEAVQAALAAQEKAVAAAFLASEKAIVKAEDAQKDYNQRSNEFRGQLDDQAKTLMPRLETTALFKAIDDKLITLQASFETKIQTLTDSNEKIFDRFTEDIKSLRESRSENTGKASQQDVQTAIAKVQMTQTIAIIGIGIAGLSFIVGIILHFIK